MQTVRHRAIDAALSHHWEDAITLNQTLLKEHKHDIDALSRLAYAHSQLGHMDEARKLYKKILSIDRYNAIAQKNLDKLSSNRSSRVHHDSDDDTAINPCLYLEEPGKTKSVRLKNTADSSILCRLRVGDTVILNVKKHSIEIRTPDKVHLGILPDDIAFRLIRLIKNGNQYHICIKSTGKKEVTVFIRETKRGNRFKNQPSFLPSGSLKELTQGTKKSPASHQDEFEE